MEKFIKIYDDLLSPNEIELIQRKSLDPDYFPWYYTNDVANGPLGKDYAPGFSHFFKEESPTSFPHSSQYELFYLNILYRLANKINMFVEHVHRGRLFLHLPSPSPTPDGIHTDLPFPHLVCLYYVTDSDGDTILYKDDKKTELQRITPKKGRVVFFDGSIPHCSSKPSQNTRVIVNFDFNGIFFGEEKKN